MPNMMSLANELLIEIIHETSAGDITSLASCSKRLHDLARGRIDFHKQMRAKAEKVVTEEDMWLNPIHPLEHLRNILKNDDVRYYTKVMKIGSFEYGDPEDDRLGGISYTRQKKALINDMEVQYSNQITALVAEVYGALLPYAAKTNLKEWTNRVVSGDTVAVTILLLALCANLKVLEIHNPGQQYWKEEKHLLNARPTNVTWGNLFRSLTITAMEPGNNRLRILSRIADFRLSGSDSGMEARAAILPAFVALPTMRRIDCSSAKGRNVNWPYSTGTSGVTELDLEGDIDSASISALISRLRAVEIFRFALNPPLSSDPRAIRRQLNRLKWGPYASDDAAKDDPEEARLDEVEGEDDSSEHPWSGDDDCRPSWDPRAITASLFQYARNSLVSLDLTTTNLEGVLEFSRDEPFIGSLRSFQALRSVYIDTMMVFKRVKGASNVEEIQPHSLVEFLPVTIEIFSMTCYYVGKGLSKKEVALMFKGMPKLKNKLPNFSKIVFKWNRQIQGTAAEKEGWEELKLRGEESDIEVSHDPREGTP